MEKEALAKAQRYECAAVLMLGFFSGLTGLDKSRDGCFGGDVFEIDALDIGRAG